MNKQINLASIPMKGKLKDWKNSIGCKVSFTYDDIIGEIEISKYVNDRKIGVIYNNNYYEIDKNMIKNCNIGNIVGKRNSDYLYNVDDIISVKTSRLKVLKQIRIIDAFGANRKGYTVRCEKDGHIYDNYENRFIDGDGCPICSNKIVVKGMNDIATTHPQYNSYFINIENAYTHSFGSKDKVWVKCPRCNAKKFMSIDKLTGIEFSCHQCSDGVSYPNKFVFNFLEQISKIHNINFYPEMVFDWAKDKRYDDYIPNLNIIIENHGMHHYKGNFENFGGKSHQEELENDLLKMELAINNGFKELNYIQLDCRYSDLEWIKNSIMNSNLPSLLNFKEDDINWKECHLHGLKSILVEVSNMWNNNFSKSDIAKAFKFNTDKVTYYLKLASKIDLCTYDIGLENKKSARLIGKINSQPIYCINTNQYFESMNLCGKILNLHPSQISRVLSGKYMHTHGFIFKSITRQEFNIIKTESPELAFGDFFILSEGESA